MASAGRPKGSKSAKVVKKKCVACERELVLLRYYATESPLFPDGKAPICKDCIKEQTDVGGLDAVKRILRQIDRPFNVVEWNKAVSSGKEAFGWYLRSINALPQYKGKGYEDSLGDGRAFANELEKQEDELYGTASIETMRKWGTGYSSKEFYELEKLWDEMMTSNTIETPQHKMDLLQYCKLTVLTNRALESGDYANYEKLNKQLTENKKNSGFRPIDKISGSESAGIRSFSQIFEEVERDGFIEPYPIEFNQDIIDKTIMYMMNYTRKLLQMEQLVNPPDDTPQMYEDEDGDE
jgi:hypothetical protein